MKIFDYDSEVWLAASPARVFEFFSDARNLERLTPPTLHFEVLTPAPIELAVGTLIDYRLRVHGFPLRWRSEITVWDPPYRFVDEQRTGPYRLWRHQHTFSDSAGGTLAEDHVEYALLGGALTNRLFVANDVRKIFEFRSRSVREIFDDEHRESFEESAL